MSITKLLTEDQRQIFKDEYHKFLRRKKKENNDEELKQFFDQVRESQKTLAQFSNHCLYVKDNLRMGGVPAIPVSQYDGLVRS